ncbi:MAG TPA: hypothetical protein DHW82_04445 [Spirochaetia bacterium]|nr:MAG: hypothetical protein A2Y41_10765 [Spirochaetes bacterium GWB1_36_13]HCL56243.1 hypothetical protein [Spirochaetia bacterium]
MKVLTKILFFFLIAVALYSDAVMKGQFLNVDYLNQVWTLKGGVSLTTTKYMLQTQQMIYFKKEKRFFANGGIFIELLEENRKIWGESLEKRNEVQFFQGNPLRLVDKNGEREIKAQTLEVRGKEKNGKLMTFNQNVNILEKNSIIFADQVIYNEKTGDIQLIGNSSIQKPEDKIKITGSNIDYNEKTKISIFKNTPVAIERKKSLIKGDKGQYDEQDDLISLEGNVFFQEEKREIQAQKMHSEKNEDEKIFYFSEQITLKEGDFHGSCDAVEYFEKQDIVNLKGNVDLKDDKKDLYIESSVVSFDKKADMTYFLGEVYIKQKDKIITGSLGNYDKQKSIIIVKGNPSYRKGKDFAKAEKIILNTETNEVEMIGGFKGQFQFNKEKDKETNQNGEKDGFKN